MPGPGNAVDDRDTENSRREDSVRVGPVFTDVSAVAIARDSPSPTLWSWAVKFKVYVDPGMRSAVMRVAFVSLSVPENCAIYPDPPTIQTGNVWKYNAGRANRYSVEVQAGPR